MTKNINISMPCPCCSKSMRIQALKCESCDLTIAGNIQANEFASLNEDDLQLLRMFLRFEGRVRDMEAPMGLSYPTIRTRIAELRDKVFGSQAEIKTKSEPLKVLENLRDGNISFDQALSAIKKSKQKK